MGGHSLILHEKSPKEQIKDFHNIYVFPIFLFLRLTKLGGCISRTPQNVLFYLIFCLKHDNLSFVTQFFYKNPKNVASLHRFSARTPRNVVSLKIFLQGHHKMWSPLQDFCQNTTIFAAIYWLPPLFVR